MKSIIMMWSMLSVLLCCLIGCKEMAEPKIPSCNGWGGGLPCEACICDSIDEDSGRIQGSVRYINYLGECAKDCSIVDDRNFFCYVDNVNSFIVNLKENEESYLIYQDTGYFSLGDREAGFYYPSPSIEIRWPVIDKVLWVEQTPERLEFAVELFPLYEHYPDIINLKALNTVWKDKVTKWPVYSTGIGYFDYTTKRGEIEFIYVDRASVVLDTGYVYLWYPEPDRAP